MALDTAAPTAVSLRRELDDDSPPRPREPATKYMVFVCQVLLAKIV